MFRQKVLVSIALVAMAAAAMPAFAQGPRGFSRAQSSTSTTTPGQTGQAKAIASVTTALTLTPTQVTSLTSLLETRKAGLQAVEQTRQSDNKTLQSILAQQSPDPTSLGNAMLAVRSAGPAAKQVETTFQTAFNSLLTPVQQQIYAALQNAANNLGPFRALGLVGGGPGGPGSHGTRRTTRLCQTRPRRRREIKSGNRGRTPNSSAVVNSGCVPDFPILFP